MKLKEKLKNISIPAIKVNSMWVFHYDGNGCDGCNGEYLACLSPAWDIERLGIRNTGNPSYADVLLVTGIIDETNSQQLIEIYKQMDPETKVIAMGPCACTGGMFSGCIGIVDGVDKLIPVDMYIGGCPTRPEAVIDALLKLKEEKLEADYE